MKATLEFNYPEDERDHKYALAGLDALLLINDLENEIREMIRRDGGYFKRWIDENDKQQSGCYSTLERVWKYIIEQKEERRLPYID